MRENVNNSFVKNIGKQSLSEVSLKKDQKQHSVPQFLLRKWMGSDKKIGLFRKDVPGLPFSRRSPKATGFDRGSYSFQGVKAAEINLVEEQVMQPIDDNAARVIDKLLESGADKLSSEDVRWLFIFAESLEMRTPVKLKSMKDMAHSLMIDGLDSRSESDREILEFIEGHPELHGNLPLKNLGSIISDSARIVQSELKFCGVVDFTGQRNHLLLSDSPCIRTTGVADPGVVFALPLNPWKAVLGFKTMETQQRFLGDIPRGRLLSRINESSFAQTTRRIYALNETPRRFLETRLKAEMPKSG